MYLRRSSWSLSLQRVLCVLVWVNRLGRPCAQWGATLRSSGRDLRTTKKNRFVPMSPPRLRKAPSSFSPSTTLSLFFYWSFSSPSLSLFLLLGNSHYSTTQMTYSWATSDNFCVISIDSRFHPTPSSTTTSMLLKTRDCKNISWISGFIFALKKI